VRGLIALGAGIALAAASAHSAERPVQFLPADQVAQAFAKGMPLVEQENYKIHASRRPAGTGQVEIHEKDTDIIYMLTGSATLVTGGRVAGARPTAPEEVRGDSSEGGESRSLKPGDVVIVPNGVPHWFKEVPEPITYYVVKVRAEGGPR
jgi:glc operon protein GlcG